MCKGRRKSNVDHTNKEEKGKISEEEKIKIPNCNRKGHVETVNEETYESSSEEEYIVIPKCRRSQVDNMNEEVKVWTSLLKQQ